MANKFTYVVTATNIINDSREVDTALAPFYVSVLQHPGTEANDYEDEEDFASVEGRATDLAVEQANAVWGTQWYSLDIRWVSENGNGDNGAYNPHHWTAQKKSA
jgi:hypothetical protein